jgi:hypothetical protein
MQCPKCNYPLESVDTDDRCEWRKEYYYCKECDETFELYTVFKCQSNIIDRQTLYDSEGNEVG